MQTLINIKASQPQHVPAGVLLGKMYYGGFLSRALTRNEYSGYPHNGGEHTLYLTMGHQDLGAFLSLVEETYQGKHGATEFVEAVRAIVRKNYPRLQLN